LTCRFVHPVVRPVAPIPLCCRPVYFGEPPLAPSPPAPPLRARPLLSSAVRRLR
jgi:hypothetical protein